MCAVAEEAERDRGSERERERRRQRLEGSVFRKVQVKRQCHGRSLCFHMFSLRAGFPTQSRHIPDTLPTQMQPQKQSVSVASDQFTFFQYTDQTVRGNRNKEKKTERERENGAEFRKIPDTLPTHSRHIPDTSFTLPKTLPTHSRHIPDTFPTRS